VLLFSQGFALPRDPALFLPLRPRGNFLLPSSWRWYLIDKICFLSSKWRFAYEFKPLEEHAVETLFNYLDARAKEIKDSLTHFMLNHSSIEARKPYDEIWCMGPEGDRYFADMDRVGVKMQAYLSECYAHFYSMLDPFLSDQPEDVISKISKSKEVITRTIDHRLTFCESSKNALHLALKALDEQLELVKTICEEKKKNT
jgi:hypothetical protein